MTSIEEKIEEHYKKILDSNNIRHYGKTETINSEIANALKSAPSKSGGSGNNYPDIQLLLDKNGRRIPVMIEAKGTKGKLEKRDKKTNVISNVDKDVAAFAVNGALHYGEAILDYSSYSEVIIIGVNGTGLDSNGIVTDAECIAYYVSKKNNKLPKVISAVTADDWSILANKRLDELFDICDKLTLTDDELEEMKRRAEITLEEKIKSMHQAIYDNADIKTSMTTNDKLYLFCGLIMAGLRSGNDKPLSPNDLHGNDNERNNDGKIILSSVEGFLVNKNCTQDKIDMVVNLLTGVFSKPDLWRPKNGESLIKKLFRQVEAEIIPCLEGDLHLDFTGRILNSLNDWVTIDNDKLNDVVLTPSACSNLMLKISRTDRNSFVWDKTMGSGRFLVSAMDIMIKDAQNNITNKEELEAKIKHIKQNQLLGLEILGNIYLLAVLNLILMGDGSSNVINGDSHNYTLDSNAFPANVFCQNPPYSERGKGMVFMEEAMNQMTHGYACVLIQENAGSGQGQPYTKRILEHNTLVASIHMPSDLFIGKASVQTAIYLFKVGVPHDPDSMVKFIDFSNDGYSRQNRKKSTQEVNLRDTDHAKERYAEVEAIILGKKPKTSYYTRENGLFIEDTVGLTGDDWTFNQHRVIDKKPTEEDFKKVVADYLGWKVGALMRGEY